MAIKLAVTLWICIAVATLTAEAVVTDLALAPENRRGFGALHRRLEQ
ncbi:hypothetical protein [Streptomyces griseosporeus]